MDRPIRFVFFRLLFLLVFLTLTLRLFEIQILRHDHYLSLAKAQHYQFNKILSRRGSIFSSDSRRLAANKAAFLIFANPYEIADAKAASEILAPILWAEKNDETEASYELLDLSGIKPLIKDLNSEKKELLAFINDLKEKLLPKNLYWVALFHWASKETVEKIQSLKIDGIYFSEETKRVHPEGLLGSHFLGFVGKNEAGENFGYFGLEGFYNIDLSGKDGLGRVEKDAQGNLIPLVKQQIAPAVDGRDLVLTINRELQYLLEKDLKSGVEKYQADGGSVILLDPKTGAILALANYPNYSPQYWPAFLGNESDVSKIAVFGNAAISQTYEPGSVFKPVTMAAALESKAVNPSTIFDDSGPLTVSGHTIRTWDNKYHGKINMARILQLSDNTGAAFVGMKVGLEKFYSFIKNFGFGKTTGVDLQGEDLGIIKPKKEWRDIDVATAAFGQGIAITPLQLVQAYSAFANNGTMMRPYLVQKIITTDKSIEIKPQKAGQPISANTARLILEMLRSVVDEGEFKWFVKQAGLEKWDLGGKTGTAQIPVNGQYDPSQTKVTFIGLAPTSFPRFILLVKLDKPKTSTYSADTAVPLWLEMVKKLVVYFKIAPRY